MESALEKDLPVLAECDGAPQAAQPTARRRTFARDWNAGSFFLVN